MSSQTEKLPQVRDDLSLERLNTIIKVATLAAESKVYPEITVAAQAAMRLLRGQELGVGPATALENIRVIHGKTVPSAGLMAALIKRSGKYDYAIKRCDDECCQIEFYEGGRLLGVASYTIEEAKRAGLTADRREGPVNPWVAYPSDMLYARAMTRGARRFCPDVFGGPIYTEEEITSSMSTTEGTIIDLKEETPKEEETPAETPTETPTREPEGPAEMRRQLSERIVKGWQKRAEIEPAFITPMRRWNSIVSSGVLAEGELEEYNQLTYPADRIQRFLREAGLERLSKYFLHLKRRYIEVKEEVEQRELESQRGETGQLLENGLG